MKKRISTLLLALCSTFICHSQIDNEFWFAAPTIDGAGLGFDKPVVIRATTFANAATVTISLPADNTFTPIVVNIGANATQTIDLTPYLPVLQSLPNTTNKNGILIQSTANITAYYEVVNSSNCVCNPEVFSLKGKNAKGTDFYISSQTTYANDTIRFPNTQNGFDIVATEDNTVVTITTTKNIYGHAANVPFNITLNKGETYSAIAIFRSAYAHLDGSQVTASKPVAVTLKDDLLFGDGACADLIGDQTIPVSVLGKEYIVARGSLAPADRVFILAVNDNTNISLDGVATTTLAKGKTYTFQLSNNNVFITSSEPVYVYHVTGYGCELGSAIIPKLKCTGSSSVSVVRSSVDPFSIMLTAKSTILNSFTVNGNTGIITAANFTVVPGTGGTYYTARIDLSANIGLNQVANIQNSAGKFSMGFLNGAVIGGARYGFFSDFKSSNVYNSEVKVCEKDSVQLNAFGGVSYTWLPAAGLSSTVIPDPKASPAITTNYTVLITDIDGCQDSATIKVNVDKKPEATIAGNTICKNETGQLSLQVTAGTGPFTVSYADAANTYSVPAIVNNQVFHILTNAAATTNYTLLSVQAANGCITTLATNNTASIIVNPLPVFTLSDDTEICEGLSIDLSVSGTNTYAWSPSTSLSTAIGNNTKASPLTTTKYYVTATDLNNCKNIDSVTISVNPKPVVDAGAENIVCKNTPFQLHGSGNGTATWLPAAALNNNSILNPTGNIASSTMFYLTIKDAKNCEAIDSVKINTHPAPVFSLAPADTNICKGTSLQLLATGGDIYTWTSNAILSATDIANPTAAINENTLISVEIKESNCNQSAILTTTITAINNPVINVSKSNDLDCTLQFAQLTATGGTTYEWSPAVGLNNPAISNPIATPAATTTYIVKGIDNNNCFNYAEVLVAVNNAGQFEAYMPSAFSPNNDGKNDCIGVRNLVLTDGFELSIFNRWGERVFFSKNSTECWNGRFKGQLQDSGVFVYYLKAKSACGNIFRKGTITLIK